MENKTSKYITRIDRVLKSERLLKRQRETLEAFDRYNELEANCGLGTRKGYLDTLHELGAKIREHFEEMSKEDLQGYIHAESKHHKEGTIQLYKQHIKRFFKWLEWIRVNKGKRDEDKVDLKDVKVPYSVRWMKLGMVESDMTLEDLPTEEEVKRIASCVERQRDRALILTLWETGASPIEILGLRVKDVAFNQYGGNVRFRRYTKGRTKQVNKLKTPYRYRLIPISSCVPDLQLWLSMHPQKDNHEAPLWLSQKGGKLSYQGMLRNFQRAVEKAGIKKKLTPYSFRHMRLTQVAPHLGDHELKRFAGHSKYSNITPRYLHADDKAIQTKILKERGVEVKPEEPSEKALTVKVCPRCKHKNSPTFRFCAMCSMPLDTKTLFEVQRRGEFLTNIANHKGLAVNKLDIPSLKEDEKTLVFKMVHNGEEYLVLDGAEASKGKLKLLEINPETYKQLQKRFYESIVAEHLKAETT